MVSIRTNSGRALNEQWKVGAQHALYHKDGTWYEVPQRFPAALFDHNGNGYGCVLFGTKEELLNCPHLRIGRKLNVPGGISKIPGYARLP